MGEKQMPQHVHDLPQLYQKPSSSVLTETLENLRLQPISFEARNTDSPGFLASGINDGVPRYLTSIVSSSLSWLEDDTTREQIWELASICLSERSGRSAMPSMTRTFTINDDLAIRLFEPSLTEDNLGLKTWTSSLLLARRLGALRKHVPKSCRRVLELGAGTGLVGIAAACIWDVNVTLTDLQDIIPNLRSNVESNLHLLAAAQRHSPNCTVRALDWSDESCAPDTEAEMFQVIVAADPIYTADHPRMLVDTVKRWICPSSASRFIVELPIREGYDQERNDLRARLHAAKMELVEGGTEIGYDDWQGQDGQPAEVECWWSVWKPVLDG